MLLYLIGIGESNLFCKKIMADNIAQMALKVAMDITSLTSGAVTVL
jgi:hypothetical protein